MPPIYCIRECCNLNPHIEEQTSPAGKPMVSIYCPKCGASTWYYRELVTAIKDWGIDMDTIDRPLKHLAYSNMMHMEEKVGRSRVSIALWFIAAGIVSYLVGLYLFT
jgi:hypothetical protein